MTAGKIDVTIRIAQSEAGRLGEIVDALKSCGLGEVQSHARFLIVNGCVSPDALDTLRAIEGVASVRRDGTYKAQGG